MSPRASEVVQLTLRPPESLAQRPFGDATTPGRTPSVTTARSRHRPAAVFNDAPRRRPQCRARGRVVRVDLDERLARRPRSSPG